MTPRAEMVVRNWPIAYGRAFAQRALEWRPFRSPRVATRDYFGGGAWTAARTCNMPYRNAAHNPCHCDTRPGAHAARLPNTGVARCYSISLLQHPAAGLNPRPTRDASCVVTARGRRGAPSARLLTLSLHSILKLKQFCNRCSH